MNLTNSAIRGFLLMQVILFGAFTVQLVAGLVVDDLTVSVPVTVALCCVLAGAGGWYVGRTREPAATVLIACSIPLLIGTLFGLWIFVAASVALPVGFFLARVLNRAGATEASEPS